MAVSKKALDGYFYDDWFLWAIVLIALGARIWLCGSIPLLVPADGAAYYKIAMQLLHGPRVSALFDTWRSPGYPLWLAAMIATFGSNPVALVAGQVALSAISAATYYRVGAVLGGRVVGVLAGLFVALHPALIAFDHVLLSETLALCLQGIFMCVIVQLLRTGTNAARWFARACVAGFVGALMTLVRPSQLVLVVAVVFFCFAAAVIVTFVDRDRGRQLLARAAVIGVVSAASLSPWFITRFQEQHQVTVAGVGDIGRLVFGMRAGFVSPAAPELRKLVPDLPARWSYDHQAAGWIAVDAKRQTGVSEPQINQWARAVVNREVRQYPAAFIASAAETWGSLLGLQQGRMRELDYFITEVIADPIEYRAASSLIRSTVPAPLLSERFFGPRRWILIRWYERTSEWRYPVLFLLFLAIVPAAMSRMDTALAATAVLFMAAALVLLLAPVDRYVIMYEPLAWIALIATVRQAAITALLPRPGRWIALFLLLAVGPAFVATASYAGTRGAAGLHDRAFRALVNRADILADSETLWRLMLEAARREQWVTAFRAWQRIRLSEMDTLPPRGILEWLASQRSSRGETLLKNGSFRDGTSGWSISPEWTPRVKVVREQPSEDPAVELRFASGNWQALSQGVRLNPDTPYVYEMTVRSTAPVIALYWEVDSGPSYQQGHRYPAWTRLTYVFVTPHWGGKPRKATVSPVLIQGPGVVSLREITLASLSVPSREPSSRRSRKY